MLLVLLLLGVARAEAPAASGRKDVKKSAARRFRVRISGEGPAPGPRVTVAAEELRTLPGALGDPFRAIGMMPGVATPIALLPAYAIRGASPGMSGFYLDGMRLPQLFHLFLGSGVVHPGMLERIDYYPGAYDASIGHQAGGVILGSTRPARAAGYHGEAELRLLDLGALVEMGLPRDVRVLCAGRYGYPGPLLRAIEPRVDISYWDYQCRLDYRGLTVEALGSYDSIDLDSSLAPSGADFPSLKPYQSRLQFHRLQVREQGRVGALELETALVLGMDETGDQKGQAVRKLFAGLRGLLRARLRRLSIDAGIDGEVSRFWAQNVQAPAAPITPAGTPGRGALNVDDLGELGQERVGVVLGSFLSGTVSAFERRLLVTLGARLDLYHASGVTVLGFDPRLTLKLRPAPFLGLDAGVGVYQQPPNFPVPLPGIDTFALHLGLQRALHGAVGEELSLPAGVSLRLGGFYQRFMNVTDVIQDTGLYACPSPPPSALSGVAALSLRLSDGESYGLEVLLRRLTGRVTGWLAYTLSRSERASDCGLVPADYDQTHVLNAVGQVRLPGQVRLGLRLMVATGKPVTVARADGSVARNNDRLPTYVQLDLRLDRQWSFRRFALALFVEVLNATYSETILSVTYGKIMYQGQQVVDLRDPQPQGFRWALPSLGLRAVF